MSRNRYREVGTPFHAQKRRSGLIFPLAVVMVCVLFTLGCWFLFSTVQSKNIFQVFYRDDIARLIAESAVAEWRATFDKRLSADPKLKGLIDSAKGSPVPITYDLGELKKTSEIAGKMAGSGKVDFSLTISIRNVDKTLSVGTKKSAFGQEFQGTLRSEVRIAIGPTGKRRTSSFTFDFDLKQACLRSRPGERPGQGYTSSAMNDYVLFIRDAWNEYEATQGRSVNNDSRKLVIRHLDNSRPGKAFFGCAEKDDPERKNKYSALNITAAMEPLIPDPPGPTALTVDWNTLKSQNLMPQITTQIENAVNQAQSSFPGAGIDVKNVRATITLDFKPLVGNSGWAAALPQATRKAYDSYFNNSSVSARGRNRETPIHLLGPQDTEFSYCGKIEGNLRQRFWQTAVFKLDFSQFSSDPAVNQQLISQIGSKFDTTVEYLSPSVFQQVIGDSSKPETQEMYKVVKFLQDREGIALMSQPCESFQLTQKPSFSGGRNFPGSTPNPPFWGRTDREVEYSNFLPFSAFLVRSYRFDTGTELFASHFFDPKNKILKLKGIFQVSSPAGLTIPKGTKFQGKGVIISYGDINIGGSLEKCSSTDGPLILFTYMGNIKANVDSEGKIEASLIALNQDFDPGNPSSPRSWVRFCGRRATVVGNLAADRFDLDSLSSSQENSLEYDNTTLSDSTSYSTTLAGRLGAMRMIFDDPGANP